MYSRNSKIFIMATCAIFQVATGFNLREDKNATDSENASAANNASSVDSLDDRFNLNLNVAQAQGFGRFGGHSQSNALSYGVNAGIRNANGHYQNLYSNSGSQSNGFSSGPGAPLTFANTGSRIVPGHAGGNAAAGLFGGRGSASAFSQNQNIEIPLDNRGTVFFSNLKAPNSTESSKAEANANSKANEPAALVFS